MAITKFNFLLNVAHFFFIMNLFLFASKTVVNTISQYKHLNELPIAPPVIKKLQDLYPTLYRHNIHQKENIYQIELHAQRSLNRNIFELLLTSKQPFPEGWLQLTFQYFKRYRYANEDDVYYLCKYCGFEQIPRQLKYFTYLITETTVEHTISMNKKWTEMKLKYFCKHCITTPLITVTLHNSDDIIQPVSYQPCLFLEY